MDTSPLSDRELLFIAFLLRQGGDAISRRIAEDIDPRADDLFAAEEKQRYAEDFQRINGDDPELTQWFVQGSWVSSVFCWRILSHLLAKYQLPPLQSFRGNVTEKAISLLCTRLEAHENKE